MREDSKASFHRYKVVRGALDFGGVVGRTQSRSKYGGTCTDSFVEFETNACLSQETKEVVPIYAAICLISFPLS